MYPALGSVNYKKTGNLDVRFGLKLSVGSLVGAVFGVCLNMLIPESGVKTLLYTVVFLSGISILLRKDKRAAASDEQAKDSTFVGNLPAVLGLGTVTGAICALSGSRRTGIGNATFSPFGDPGALQLV